GKDLHSGRHGGAVANPLHAAAALVASLHDGGTVAVDGFYDDVEPIDAAMLQSLARLSFDEPAYLASVGAEAAFGRPGFGTVAAGLRSARRASARWRGSGIGRPSRSTGSTAATRGRAARPCCQAKRTSS